MAEYQVGDRIRVTYEGEVVRTDFPQDRYAQLVHMNGSCLYLPDAATIEVIERRKPKVGDTIEGKAAYDALPIGSVVTSALRQILKTKTGWSDSVGNQFPAVGHELQRTLVFVPES